MFSSAITLVAQAHNILLIDFQEPVLLEGLARTGAKVVRVNSSDESALRAALRDATLLAIKSVPPLGRELIDLAPNLQLVVRGGSGLEHIDSEYLAQKGIKLVGTPGGNADSVGEQAVGMLLALLHKILLADKQIRQLRFEREGNRGTELGARTVGIIGYGQAGSAFALKLVGFGCRILAYDKYLPGFGNERVTESTPEQIQAEADVLSLHVPLTDETHHLVNDAYIAAFARPFWLLNLARGPVVDTAAVIRGLQSGKILGAGLDVHENERFDRLTPEQLLRQKTLGWMENVILTPHIGGLSTESANNIARRVLEELLSAMIEPTT
jgi:D-3-phosphoglycerate dehydrogenase / 2-oxoglutarate reductase